MTDEQLGQLYHTARNADTFRDFKHVALDILSASIADTAGAKPWWHALATAADAVSKSADVWQGFGIQDAKVCVDAYHAATPAPSVADAAGASERIKALFIENPPDEMGPSDEPESQYRFGYNTALEDAIDAIEKESGND